MKTLTLAAAVFACLGVADGQLAIRAAEPKRVPYWDRLNVGDLPLRYFDVATDNPLFRLEKSIADGTVVLTSQPFVGYLPDLLKALEIPVDSQVLVAYSGSGNRSVTRRRPRALYFRDDMVIAYVAGSSELEIAVYDAWRGIVFYSLSQERTFELRRRLDCLGCHNTQAATTGVPGHLPRFGDGPDGQPLQKRWHGRYVSGDAPNLVHGGIPLDEKANDRALPDGPPPNATGPPDRFDPSDYLSPHSDIVANLVLDHQAYVWNWIARLNTEHRLGLRSHKDKSDHLLACALLHTYQKEFDGPIPGTSDFTKWYARQAPRDAEGRSLSELDLHHRLFQYGVSPMIYSRPFQQLPLEVKQRIYKLIDEMLAGTRPLPGPNRSAEDCALARSILRATIADYPGAQD